VLKPVEGHVRTHHELTILDEKRTVNSYHNWGVFECPQSFEVLCVAPDGCIEAVCHSTLPFLGVMWHPERNVPFDPADLDLIRNHF